jgi:dienelactone hydrolase
LLLAGTREFGRKMHDDLIDGVRWAVERGIADPKRVAIMGGSYGGYAALSGAAFTPDVFVAAVDRVGISDMVSLIEDWPRYWRVGDMGFWSRFYGDPRKPDERGLLAERSPLNHVDAIRVPLLVVQGANDIRVRRDQSDRLVAALRARNHDVYISCSRTKDTASTALRTGWPICARSSGSLRAISAAVTAAIRRTKSASASRAFLARTIRRKGPRQRPVDLHTRPPVLKSKPHDATQRIGSPRARADDDGRSNRACAHRPRHRHDLRAAGHP